MTQRGNGSGTALRVLHVAQPVEEGVPVVVRTLVTHQVGAGHQVAVACPPLGSLPAWAAAAGAEVLAWPAQRSPGPSTPGETRALGRLVHAWRPDLLHLHSSKAGLAGRLAVRGRVRTLYQPHAWSFLAAEGALRVASTAWERRGARWAHGIACVSTQEQLLGERAGVRGRWLHTPNGVDLDRYAPTPEADRARLRHELGLPADAVIAVCVARLSRQKGQDLLLDAWRGLDADPPALLVLVGDGPDRAALEAVAPAGVRFVGVQADVRPWYAVADVFVQPSRWEGASLAIREAMACGLPVVATDVAGNREIPLVGPATVPVGDVRALRARLAGYLGDGALRRADGAAARRVAGERFGAKAALAAMDDAYATVLG